MNEKLTLKPQDYIVFNGGLKIENISEKNCIELELPNKYTITPMKYTQLSTPTSGDNQ